MDRNIDNDEFPFAVPGDDRPDAADSVGPNVRAIQEADDAALAKRFDPAQYEAPGMYGDFENEFHGTHLRLTDGNPAAAIHWPQNGRNAGLAALLSHYRSSGDDAPAELLFKLLNKQLAKDGRPPWTPRGFAMVLAEVDDEAEERAEREEEKLVSRPLGRPKSQDTFIVRTIRTTLGCNRSRAHEIFKEGTTRLEQRIKLARAFRNDPARRLPRHWLPIFKASSWGRSSQRGLDRYVLDRVDYFEGGAVGDVLAILTPRFEDGWLLPDDRFDILFSAIRDQGLPISADTALTLWDRYSAWKRGYV
ncbi:MAG: hypothetical protein KIT48_04570 [Pseudolabrys sp.]|nr:hypothetical protein [Pseudolabrys sp.]